MGCCNANGFLRSWCHLPVKPLLAHIFTPLPPLIDICSACRFHEDKNRETRAFDLSRLLLLRSGIPITKSLNFPTRDSSTSLGGFAVSAAPCARGWQPRQAAPAGHGGSGSRARPAGCSQQAAGPGLGASALSAGRLQVLACPSRCKGPAGVPAWSGSARSRTSAEASSHLGGIRQTSQSPTFRCRGGCREMRRRKKNWLYELCVARLACVIPPVPLMPHVTFNPEKPPGTYIAQGCRLQDKRSEPRLRSTVCSIRVAPTRLLETGRDPRQGCADFPGGKGLRWRHVCACTRPAAKHRSGRFDVT